MVIEFNKEAWQKLCIYVNMELRRKAKNNFETLSS